MKKKFSIFFLLFAAISGFAQMGIVDGNWKLSWDDGQSSNAGKLIDVIYTIGELQADTSGYDYVFFAIQNEIILGIGNEFNLGISSVGQYSICGFVNPKEKNDSFSLVDAAFWLFMSSAWVENDCSDFSKNCIEVNVSPQLVDIGWYGCYFSRVLNLSLRSFSSVNLLVQNTIFAGAESLVLDSKKITPSQDFCAEDGYKVIFVQSAEIYESLRDKFTYLDNNNNNNNNLILFTNTSMSEEFCFSILDRNRKVELVKNPVVFSGTYTIGIDYLPQGMYWLSFASAKGILTEKYSDTNF